MRILHTNLFDACSCWASSERSGFPAINVQHPFLIKRLRTLIPTAQWVEFDAGAGNTISADTFAIIQHNLSSGATIHLQANSVDSWGSPPVGQVMTWSAGIILLSLVAAETYRLWRIYIDDPSNPVGYIEIGRMGGFLRYQAQEFPDSGLVSELIDTSMKTRSVSYQSYSDLGVRARAYEINMGTMKEATRQSLLAIYAACGQSTRLVFIPDENNTAIVPPIYCTMETVPKFTQSGGWLWKHENIRIVEEF